MTKDIPKVHVSAYEIEKNRAVASIETVRHFKGPDDEIYLIIGADNLEKLSQWKEFEVLDTMVTWVVATRSGIVIPKQYLQLKIDHDISATELREQIDEAYLDKAIAQEIIDFYQK